MDFLDLVNKRYSERFFDNIPIEQEKLDKIDSLVSEIEQLSNESREKQRIIDENKALFGEKAKLRKQAQNRLKEIEQEIASKQEEAQRIKKSL